MENSPTKAELNKKTKLTSMYFNRYLIFRYVTALFFFINLYWSVLSFANVSSWMIVPLGLLIIDIAIIIEQTAKYWKPTSRLPVTKIGYAIQMISNVLGMVMILLGHQKLLFPFINNEGKSLLVACLVLGFVIGVFVEWRIWQIEHNKDAYLKYMKQFENSMN